MIRCIDAPQLTLPPARTGYNVSTWSRSPNTVNKVDGVSHLAGSDVLWETLPVADVVICLLPLTSDTRGLVDVAFLRRMKAGSTLINAARGAHVHEGALLEALDTGAVHHRAVAKGTRVIANQRGNETGVQGI